MRWLVVLVALACVGVMVVAEGPARAEFVPQAKEPRAVVVVGDWQGNTGDDVVSYDFPDSIPYSEPSVMRVSGGPPSAYMWYCGSAYGTNFIGLRTSDDDGKGWSASTRYFLAGTGGTEGACAPSVVKVGGPTGYYYIAFESKSAPTTEWPSGAPGLFVARMKSPTGVVEYWNGAGWGPNSAAPLALGWTELWAPSLVVKDGRMFVYYTHTRQGENQGGRSWLRVATAPISDNWPAQLTRQSLLMEFPSSPAGLDVKWSPTTNRFVAMGMTATRTPMAYVSTGPDGLSFTDPHLELVHGQLASAQQPEDLAMAADVSGALSAGSWLVYQEAAQLPYNTLRRAKLGLTAAAQGGYSDTFASGAAWWPVNGSAGGTWTHDAPGGALVHTTATQQYDGSEDGQNVGTGVWAGDGLYQVEMNLDPGMSAGVQIGRPSRDPAHRNSGYTVLVANDRLMLYKGLTLIQNRAIVNAANIDRRHLELHVMRAGRRITAWLNWPGAMNRSTIDWKDSAATVPGPGYPALISRKTSALTPPGLVRFTSFEYSGGVTDSLTGTGTSDPDWVPFDSVWTRSDEGVVGAPTGVWEFMQMTAARPMGDGTYSVRVKLSGPGFASGVAMNQVQPDGAWSLHNVSGYAVVVKYWASDFGDVFPRVDVVGPQGAPGAPLNIDVDKWVDLRVVLDGGHLVVYVNDALAIDWTDPSNANGALPSGYTSLVGQFGASTGLFKDFTYTPET